MSENSTSSASELRGLDPDSRQMVLETIGQLKKRLLTRAKIFEFDREEVFPEETIREMLGPEIGLQLLMIPEAYGGLGGGARDSCAVTREMAEALGLDRPVGALVNDVTTDGSAERAGIKPGDVILSFNDAPVETWNDLPPLVGANPPGTKAVVKVSRDGKEQSFDVTLDALDSDGTTTVAENGSKQNAENVLGLVVENINSDRRRELGDPEGGVVITEIESDDAWRAGLRPGDVILMINNQNIESMDGFEALVKEIEPDRAVALRVWRNGTASFIAYTPRDRDEG